MPKTVLKNIILTSKFPQILDLFVHNCIFINRRNKKTLIFKINYHNFKKGQIKKKFKKKIHQKCEKSIKKCEKSIKFVKNQCFIWKKFKIGKSSPQKNSAINFVQNDPMILKLCFLRVSEHADSRKKKL
jgi:hypothetical protein